MKDFILFGQPEIGNDEINEVVDSLKKGWLGTGPKTKRFENDFAKYKSAKYSLALNSCTAGLHLSCLTLDGLGGHFFLVFLLTAFLLSLLISLEKEKIKQRTFFGTVILL